MAGGPILEHGTKTHGKRLIAIALLIAVVALTGACGGDDDGSAASGGSGADMDAPESEPERFALEAEQSALDEGSGGGGTTASASSEGTAARLPRVGPSVIKTATVSLGVAEDDLTESINEAIATAGRYGGFVLSSQLGRRDAGGTLTMRVPSERFETALAELEGLGRVRSEHISGEDVGQEFVDLEARLRNWETQEAVLLRLMDRAESVTDTIRVQGELSRVQLEIEQLRGRIRYLRDQTSLGTITATFQPLGVTPDAPSRFARAWERAVDLMQSFVAGAIVTTGVVLPLAVIALVIFLVARAIRPRLSA
ncbi:MAG TPA: DUF4349 domain-containing protein [Actinomycetota bacterium]|nr:DUF4349 domain-containing protein [Actinomycetota bacterium]